MAGFKRPALLLSWEEGHPYHGLEVRMRRLSIAQIGQFNIDKARRQLEMTAFGEPPEDSDVDGMARYALKLAEYNDAFLRAQAARLAENTISWNLHDDDGQPIPVSVSAYEDMPQDFTFEIAKAWQEASVTVAAPLPRPSGDGQPSRTEVDAVLSELKTESLT